MTKPTIDPWRQMLAALTGSAPADPPPAAPGQCVRRHKERAFVPPPEALRALRKWLQRR